MKWNKTWLIGLLLIIGISFGINNLVSISNINISNSEDVANEEVMSGDEFILELTTYDWANGGVNGENPEYTYVLESDVDFNLYTSYGTDLIATPENPYTIDGGGHTLRNKEISGTQNGTLFEEEIYNQTILDNNYTFGIVENVTFINFVIQDIPLFIMESNNNSFINIYYGDINTPGMYFGAGLSISFGIFIKTSTDDYFNNIVIKNILISDIVFEVQSTSIDGIFNAGLISEANGDIVFDGIYVD